MRKLAKSMILLGIIGMFSWGSAASAFELLYEEEGRAYYKADDGTIITHEIDSAATGIVLLYADEENRVTYYRTPDGRILEAAIFGGTLSNTPDYDWWYGCSPTSAGMMMGYYDIHGYGGSSFNNLVPGGTAELNTFPSGSYIANDAIASSGHIADYYSSYGSSTDPCGGSCPSHTLNCLADFMCTSDYTHCSNTDGGTTFWNWNSGARFTHNDAVSQGVTQRSGMYGVGEYVQYAGYSYVNDSLYNQKVDTSLSTYFSYNDFKNEIDAGRPALIHVTGHTMLAYGYSGASTVYVHDTWSSGGGTMTWGGSYSGMAHQSMTCLTLSGGGPVIAYHYVDRDGTCGGKSPCYSTIQAAVNAAGNGDEIRITDETYNENVTVSGVNQLTIKGGWNASFTNNPSTTVVNGKVTISGDLTNMENVDMRSP